MRYQILLKLLLLILCTFVLTACEQSQKTAKTSKVPEKKYTQAATLEGVISNNKGIIKSGILEVIDKNEHLISRLAVINGHYRVEIPVNTVLPVQLVFSSDSGTEKLIAVVIHDSITKYDINPLTTAIAKSAKAFGGYTHANMTRAAENTVNVPDANKTSAGWRGDPTKQYGGWH